MDTEKLPSGWTHERVGDLLIDSMGGGTPSTKIPSYWNGEIPWITSKRLTDQLYLSNGERSITQKALKETSTKLIPKGNVLVSTRVTVGKAMVNRCDIAISQDVTGLLLDKRRCIPEYLAYQIKTDHIQRFFQTRKRGATIKGVTRDDLKDLLIAVPSIAEQRSILNILLSVENAIANQGAIIRTTTELKKALMQKLFTEGLRGEKQKQTEIGPMPESWKVAKLGEIAKVERGKFSHRPRNDPKFYGGNIPFIQTGDVANADGRVRTYSQTLNDLGLSVSRMFPKGTIVISIAANIGDTAILEFDSAFPDSIIGITQHEGILNAFLELYLRTQKPRMNALAPKGTQKNINIQFLKPWLIPIPSMKEQAEIADALKILNDKVENSMKKKATLQALFRSMLNQLMMGQLRVNDMNLKRQVEAVTA